MGDPQIHQAPGVIPDREAEIELIYLAIGNFENYGFSPTLTLRHSETRSTDERYDTVETGLNFGFRSNF